MRRHRLCAEQLYVATNTMERFDFSRIGKMVSPKKGIS